MKTGVLTPIEQELLLCCARPQMDGETAERIRELTLRDVNWERLLRVANRNQVLPLLYWNLDKVCTDAVPGPVMDSLRQMFRDNARHNLALSRELLKILALLESKGIPALPLKGPLLAETVYFSVALRQFTDLDILVQEKDIRETRKALSALGYTPRGGNRDWGIGNSEIPESPSPHSPIPNPHSVGPVCVYERDDGLASVDLHWGLSRSFLPFTLDEDGFWKRLQTILFLGKPVLNAQPEDTLLFLCMHGTRHLWSRLEWICDVAALIRAYPNLDWGRVMAQALKVRGERMLFLGLLLADGLLGAPVPATPLNRARADSTAVALVKEVPQRVFRENAGPEGVVERVIFRMKARERLSDKTPNLAFLARRALKPTERDHSLVKLPSMFSFLYYLIRPLRLVGEYSLGSRRRSS